MLGQLSETKQLPFLLKASRCGGTEDDVVKFDFDCWMLNLSSKPILYIFLQMLWHCTSFIDIYLGQLSS